jgi:hypothetical protein
MSVRHRFLFDTDTFIYRFFIACHLEPHDEHETIWSVTWGLQQTDKQECYTCTITGVSNNTTGFPRVSKSGSTAHYFDDSGPEWLYDGPCRYSPTGRCRSESRDEIYHQPIDANKGMHEIFNDLVSRTNIADDLGIQMPWEMEHLRQRGNWSFWVRAALGQEKFWTRRAWSFPQEQILVEQLSSGGLFLIPEDPDRRSQFATVYNDGNIGYDFPEDLTKKQTTAIRKIAQRISRGDYPL